MSATANVTMQKTTDCPPGAKPGGSWTHETYVGTTTLIIIAVLCIVALPFAWSPLCCPCDSREVYIAPDGNKLTRSGAHVPAGDCCGHPCGGPNM